MWRVTLRSLWEHKRRLASTVVAIVLGVAFMSGTFVIADTIDRVFGDLFADVNEAIDVRVQGVELFDGGFGPTARETLDPAVVDAVRSVEGVRVAEPFIMTVGFGSQNRVLGPDGDPLGSSVGPPTLIQSWVEDVDLNPYKMAEGEPPTADDHIAMNVAAVEDAGFALGDPVRVVSQVGESTYTLVGTFTFGEAASSGGSVSANFTLAEVQRLAGLEGRIQEVVAAGDGSVDQVTLADRVGQVLPPQAEALTGVESSEQNASDVQEGFAFFRQMLSVFAGIALIVGTFIIANTFSILVAQRTRELALLRAIGGSRGQVLGSVLLEAAVIGLVAAVLGLLAGIGLALAVTRLLVATGADLPTPDLVIGGPTVLVALALGLGITVLASVVPAVQATRVAPLAALREVAVDRAGTSRARVVLGALLLLLGAFQLSAAWRIEDTDALGSVGMGALLLIVGAIVVGPVLAQPTVRVLGAFLPRLRGITGTMATENAARSPKRTSATASALLIGVTLVGFITIFASSAQESVVSEVERGFTGDLIVQSESSGFGPPGGFPPTVADDVAAVEGVETVSRIGFTMAQITYPDGRASTEFIQSVDPATLDQAFDARMAEAEVTDLQPGGIMVDVGVAEDHLLSLGDTVTVTGRGGQSLDLVVQALSDDLTLLGFAAIDTADYERLVEERQLVQLVVSVAGGADVDAVRADIEMAVASIPAIEVLDRDGFIGTLTDQITSFLTLVNALLLLSIIIAMIGIANTLSLSIHERTRELGLLRAVGMTRSQLRSAIRWEAVLIAVLGTLVGLGIGLIVSWALVTALGSFGLTRFVIPFGTLAVVVLGTAVLGVIASIRPARRAARLDVLDAIAFE